MLGLLLLYWIGKYFYKLAEKYNKNKWGFAILGVAVYYGGILIFSVLIGVLLGIFAPESVDNINEVFLGLLMIPFGLLTSYSLYKILENGWRNKAELTGEGFKTPIEYEEDSEKYR